MEKREEFVVVKDTATDMVCMRLVSLKEELHFWPFWNINSTSFVSAFTNLMLVGWGVTVTGKVGDIDHDSSLKEWRRI
ncbi:hypothetical protein glysoja_010990 [Glycine soja]|nr:hypothetical protein glysoja_010990 [Glycine soja]